MTRKPGRRKSSLYLLAALVPPSPAPTVSPKDTAQIAPKQYAPPPETLPVPPPTPRLQNNAGGIGATRKTLTEPATELPPPASPASAGQQTTHNSDQACATSKACTRLYPACSTNRRCPVRTGASATPTAPRLTERSIRSPL